MNQFETYENVTNTHVTIHKTGCGHIRKHGGVHLKAKGQYISHKTYAAARSYALGTGIKPVNDCKSCKPS